MTPRYMLDTDSVSYAIKGIGNVKARLIACRPSEACMSAISFAEIAFGAECRGSKRLTSGINDLVAVFRPLPFDEIAARQFGKTATYLANAGTPIGHFDTMIASHALALRVTLITNNLKHFSRVPGLKLDNWI